MGYPFFYLGVFFSLHIAIEFDKMQIPLKVMCRYSYSI